MQDSSELPLGQFVISGAHVPFYKNPGPAANMTTFLLAGADVPEDEIDPLSKAARFLCFYLTGIPVVKSLDMDEGPAFGCQVRTVMQQQEHLDRTTENLCDYHHAQREECCQLQEAVSSNYTRVLKIMKYFHQAVARHVTERSDKADLERLTKTLGNVKPRGVYNHDPTVVACKYGRTKLSTDCDFFSRWLTAGGMGYTFNHVPFWDMFTETEANKVFFNEMYAKENLTRQEEGIPRNIVSMGSAFSFELMAKFQDYRGARLMVHSPWELPEEGDSGLRLEAGRTYTIKLVPSAITTDGAAQGAGSGRQGMPLRQRGGRPEVLHLLQPVLLSPGVPAQARRRPVQLHRLGLPRRRQGGRRVSPSDLQPGERRAVLPAGGGGGGGPAVLQVPGGLRLGQVHAVGRRQGDRRHGIVKK